MLDQGFLSHLSKHTLSAQIAYTPQSATVPTQKMCIMCWLEYNSATQGRLVLFQHLSLRHRHIMTTLTAKHQSL